MRVCANPHIFFTYTLYGMVPRFAKMATFSLNSRSLFARNCILATNKQFTKSPLQQAAARYTQP